MKTALKRKTSYKKNYATTLQNVFQKNQTFDQNKKNAKSSRNKNRRNDKNQNCDNNSNQKMNQKNHDIKH